jgi:outer membrane receptor protein involved in Fe transport
MTSGNSNVKTCLFAGVSSIIIASMAGFSAHAQSAAPVAGEAAAPAPMLGEIIVTAQRRSESLQAVPMAISAFTQEALEVRRLDTGSELIQSVPNITFSKGFFQGFNFQIRGVGSQLGTTTADAGVGIHLNNVPLTISRFFEAEFYDTERVEVLRGPQGTLYGRNSTGGVVNVITAKPVNEFEAMVSGELATYSSYKTRGMLNLPLIDEKLAVRVAGSTLKREGFGINIQNGERVNGRDLWSARATVLAKPFDNVEATLLYQHFNEDDDRSRHGGSICVQDPGPSSVGGVAVTNPLLRGYLSAGCSDRSIYGENANSAPNSLGSLFGFFTQTLGVTDGNFFEGKRISSNLHDKDTLRGPRYRTTNDLYTFQLAVDVTPSLKVTAISSYMKDKYYAAEEFLGAVPNVRFNSTALTPGGFFDDPQLGRADRLVTGDIIKQYGRQYTNELRIDSSFSGPFNFSLGANVVDYKTRFDAITMSNALTLFATFRNGGTPCPVTSTTCIYIDPNAEPTGLGHNYLDVATPYTLDSKAVFGEAYFEATENLKLTLGARYTQDKKSQIVLPTQLLAPGAGLRPGPVPTSEVEFKEPTGRVGVDWTPDFGFTDRTLIYATLSRGYKAGGTNPPTGVALKPPYQPEFVNSFEVGTKNTILDGRATLNVTGFFYDYKGYQIGVTRERSQTIENIDAEVKGLEIEANYEPVSDLTFNGSLGLIDSKITKGDFVDPMNFLGRAQGVTLVRGPVGASCGVNTNALAAYLATNPSPATFVNSVCNGLVPGLTPNVNGVNSNVEGNELPNTPKVTLTVGGQYVRTFGADWKATLRADYHWQSKSFARVFNTEGDRLRAYGQLNMSLTVASEERGWSAQAFVKNLTNSQPVTNTFIYDASAGLTRIGFVTDPRIMGLSIAKHF